jgi:hypothetical protein
LLEVHADPTEEAERIGAQRRAPGVAGTRLRQPKLIAQRAIYEELAKHTAEFE